MKLEIYQMLCLLPADLGKNIIMQIKQLHYMIHILILHFVQVLKNRLKLISILNYQEVIKALSLKTGFILSHMYVIKTNTEEIAAGII